MDDDRPPGRALRLRLIRLVGVIPIGYVTITEGAGSDLQDPTSAARYSAQRPQSIHSLDIGPDPASAAVEFVVSRIPARPAAPPDQPCVAWA